MRTIDQSLTVLKTCNPKIPSVNYHLWQACNMRCKFCFATFQDVKQSVLPKGHLPQKEALKVVQSLADAGFEKITFAGGEPTLCPWLFELIQCAKSNGMTTMIVTNGSRITDEWLIKYQKHLDWITVSIDSLDTATNLLSGRALTGKKALAKEHYIKTLQKIKQTGYRLKINTVVSATNWQEDMSDFIIETAPERWKLFQVLPVSGQNSGCVDDFLITAQQFNQFIDRHAAINQHLPVVPENNDQMTASYVMVDPAGRFFDNSIGQHSYSRAILSVGVEEALKDVHTDYDKFVDRDGLYKWSAN